MFQKERCSTRLQIECYFLPITFADLFSPTAHLQTAWQQTQFPPFDNFPSSHTALPWPGDTSDPTSDLSSTLVGRERRGEGCSGGVRSALKWWGMWAQLLLWVRGSGGWSIAAAGTQVRALLKHLESWYQWVPRWNIFGRTSTLNFSLFTTQCWHSTKHSTCLIHFAPLLFVIDIQTEHIFMDFIAKVCNCSWALQEPLHFILPSETEKYLWWVGYSTLRSVFINLP